MKVEDYTIRTGNHTGARHTVTYPAFTGSVLLTLAFILPALGLSAAQPPPRIWLPLAKKEPAPTQVTLNAAPPNTLRVTFSVPGLVVGEEAGKGGIHGRIAVPGAGHTPDVGKPELPVIRRLIVVPADAAPSVSWKGTARQQSIAAMGLRGPILPRQPPVPKIPGAREKAPFVKDPAAYATNGWIPAEPVSLKECGALFGCRLVMIEVSPVAYNPVRNEALLYPGVEVSVSLGSAKGPALTSLSPAEMSTLQSLTLNAGDLPAATAALEQRLLIIAGNAFTNSLDSFIAHKQSLGWAVDLFGTASAGASTNQIQSFVRTRYQNTATRPSALLLVGDTDTVPRFIGSQTDTPDTDLYYACMDGAGDWLPELPVGRFSVTTTASLGIVLAKSITAETNAPAAWNRRFVFMAGDDNHSITEATHDYVIASHLDPRSLASDKLYTSTYGASTPLVSSAFNAGRTMGVYSGHGNETQWADGPVFLASDVTNLTNKPRYPFVCSFACLTGRFGYLTECFAETWLRAPSGGAAAMLASSVTSYWEEDDILEKKLFEALFAQPAPSSGPSILSAKHLYLLHYGNSATTHRYFEMYNLFGDPTLLLLRRPAAMAPDTLPPAYVGEPYSLPLMADASQPPCTWQVTAGTLPARFSLNPTNGLISGTAASTGASPFTVSFTDSALVSTSRTYTLTIIEHLRPPVSCAMPVAVSNRPYQAAIGTRGGVPPIAWTWNYAYAISNASSGWLGQNNSMGWSADDRSWFLPLPWPFPFFGQVQTSLWVCSNGFLDFRSGASNYLNSAQDFKARRMIAPLWDDLTTAAGGKIHVTTSTNRVVVRWDARNYADDSVVNIEAVLNRSGLIQFNYGSPALASLTPTIGISAGDGINYYFGPYDNSASIPANTTVIFSPPAALPSALAFLATGVVTGRPSQTGTFSIPCRVNDSATPPEATNFNLCLTVFDSQLATTQGTPFWWLASFNLTNTVYNSEDQLDRDGDGMPAWQEYVAGTDPTSGLSALRLLGLLWSNDAAVLQWQSAESPLQPQPPYVIWASSNLSAGNWAPLTNVNIRTPPLNSAPLPTLPPDTPAFFRITITN